MKDDISPKLLKLIRELHEPTYILMSDGTIKMATKQKIK